MLPLQNRLAISLQPGINGHNRLNLLAPGFTHPLVTYWSQSGLLLGVRQPGASSSSAVYKYDGSDRLINMRSGDFATDLQWEDGGGRLAKVQHQQIDQLEIEETFTYFDRNDVIAAASSSSSLTHHLK